jgi:hypothetical protein
MEATPPSTDAPQSGFDAVDAGAAASTSGVDYPVAGAPSDNTTLVSVLQAFEQQGFTEQFIAGPDGTITCASCNESFPAAEFRVEASRRLEGASDPDDMMTVVAGRCARCEAAGTLVLGYGPNATEDDIAISQAFGDLPAVDPDAPGASLFLGGDAIEPNEPA